MSRPVVDLHQGDGWPVQPVGCDCGAESRGGRVEGKYRDLLEVSAPSTRRSAPQYGRRDILGWGLKATAVAALGAGAAGGIANQVFDDATEAGAATRAPDLLWRPPPIVTRAQWGANENLRKGAPVFDAAVEKLIVHHTVTPNGPADPAAIMRSIYAYHTSGVYIDIAYNLAIDEQGRIYEGRWAQSYGPGIAHTGENAFGAPVHAAHALNFNDRTVGIALLGTFTNVAPPAPMLAALVEVLAWKCARWGLDPFGRSVYVNGNGDSAPLDTVCGHRAVTQTLCPGDPLLGSLAQIRHDVANRILAGSSAYWTVGSNGVLLQSGRAHSIATPSLRGSAVIAATDHVGQPGAWFLLPHGRVYPVHGARHYGDAAHIALHAPVTGIEASRTGRGYYLVANDGGVFCFGDARFHGSLGALHLRAPIVGMHRSASGRGYRLLGADGGVFCFGDARYYGAANTDANVDPAVALTPTASTRGYWITLRSGKILRYGDAPRRVFTQSAATGIVAVKTTMSGGLVGVAADGAYVNTANAPKLKSMNGRLRGAAAVGIVGII